MLKENTVYCGDCLEILKDVPDKSIDLLVTDPPYELGKNKGGGLYHKREWLKNVSKANLDNFNPHEFLNIIKPKLKIFNAYIFCSKELLVDYINFCQENGYKWDILIMAKNNPIPTKNNKYLSDKEYILFIRESGAYFNNNLPFESYFSVKRVNVKPSTFGHPTEKQESIIKSFIEVSSKENDLILDPFLGSGTTAVACLNTNRKFIGIEKEKKYCEISENRIKDTLKEKDCNFF